MKSKFIVPIIGLSLLLTSGSCFAQAVQTDNQVTTTQLIKAKQSITGAITINGTNYKWMETSRNKNRGMTFNPGNHIYFFSPNPHKDPWYNKHQRDFYNQAANAIKQIGDREKWTKEKWVPTISIQVHGITYNLNKN